ncbi:MAG: polyphosphate kinase 1 [Acidobacteria bacterium]|nr:polyphosphate kinase 1 [Acidobacteriota bacterium]
MPRQSVAKKPLHVVKPAKEQFDLSSPEWYMNRELTWLAFNRRVLHEAEDSRTPLLERLKFVAIVCSNLDEFFMKRIGGLKQQIFAGVTETTIDGRTPVDQLKECHAVIREIDTVKSRVYHVLISELKKQGIELLRYDDLTKDEKAEMRSYYFDNIFPLMTPQGIDPAHPFPFISNLSLNLLVALRHSRSQDISLSRVKVPVGHDVPRFLAVGDSRRFVTIEDVIAHNLDLLFPKMNVLSCEVFRVTRNAVTELDEDQADDLLAMIETELRYRKFASVVRLQVEPGMHPTHRGMLAAELGLDEMNDVFEVEGMIGKSGLMEIWNLDLPELKDPPHYPIDHPRTMYTTNIFHNIRRNGDILLAHPYESFSTSVERFLAQASEDPKVRAIKMTLYRTAKNSQVIQSLINAARNGKQVAVVVELKARFDEAANIRWANQLEQAGIHVTYGVVGLKTHTKVILVVRRDYDRIRRYAHFGTGNYNSFTARIYTDFGLLTCDDELGEDLTELFNYLTTGYTPNRTYKRIIVAPSDMKNRLLGLIDREIKYHLQHKNGYILMKMNALEDPDITRQLYRAGQAGVKVDLIVRDTCRLRPGIEGLSQSIRVISVVGRFLEHARVFHFHSNGEELFYIGSADCMKRNLESRVEVFAPVLEDRLKRELRCILNWQLQDTRGVWEMQSDGSYVQLTPKSATELHSQSTMIEVARKRAQAISKPKRLKTKGKSRRAFWAAYSALAKERA